MKTQTQTKRVHLFAPFSQKSLVQATERTFEGLLSTWNEDLGGDVIHKGAFARTLDLWRGSGGKKIIPLLDQHGGGWFGPDSVRKVVGKMIDAEEREEGLWTKWSVIASPDGDEVLARIEGEFVNGLSIGYDPVWDKIKFEDHADGSTTRHIYEVKLWEGSVVVWGMNEEALIDPDSVKSFVATMTEEQKTQFRALLAETEAPAPAPAELAPEAMSALQMKLLGLKLNRLSRSHVSDPGAL